MQLASQLAVVAFGVALLHSVAAVEGDSVTQANIRKPASVSYRPRSDCPALCSVSGFNPTNWTVYPNLDLLSRCTDPVFYHFSIFDLVDTDTKSHRIYACTSNDTTTGSGVGLLDSARARAITNGSFSLGSWDEQGAENADLRELSVHMRHLLGNGYAAANGTALVLFAQTARGTSGLYAGKGVDIQATGGAALAAMENALQSSKTTAGNIALQLCEDSYKQDHVFGFIATSRLSFTPIQQAMQSWANSMCLEFDNRQRIISPVGFTMPLSPALNTTTNGANVNSSASPAGLFRRVVSNGGGGGGDGLRRRADCTTIQVVKDDGCAELAARCGISGYNFEKYNSNTPKLCSTLVPFQHVCCSEGTLPDFRPQPNPDGSCATYTTVADDTCWGIAAARSLTIEDLDKFNKKTWGWNGCNLLWVGVRLCVSAGEPPMPAEISNAVCGPQKPGTPTQPSGTDLSKLNPCPLNVCCNIWGQCGTTGDFCIDTNTGAPGTAKEGTYGCISNCGMDIIQGAPPAQFMRVGYFQGYGLSRACLNQDARQIDTQKFTHIHFAFGLLSQDYTISTGDAMSTYEFNAFKTLTGVKRILAFGGWAFSTEPATYNIFRQGVTAANRLKMATNIANFIKENNLDGVDIDWEYPGVCPTLAAHLPFSHAIADNVGP
jgi:hypothetical protein